MGLSLFTWIESWGISVAIRDSSWLFPAVEAVHLLGLALIGGAVLIVDLRLMGLALRDHPLASLAHEAERWGIVSLVIALPTGFLLFASEAVKCYEHAAFWFKMGSLVLALLFMFTVRRRVTRAGQAKALTQRLVGLTSLLLWTGVGVGGRWIGFS